MAQVVVGQAAGGVVALGEAEAVMAAAGVAIVGGVAQKGVAAAQTLPAVGPMTAAGVAAAMEWAPREVTGVAMRDARRAVAMATGAGALGTRCLEQPNRARPLHRPQERRLDLR